MSLIVLSQDVAGSSTVVLTSGLISSPFRINSIIAVCSTGGNTDIRFTPLLGNDNDTGITPISGTPIFSVSSGADFVFLTMHPTVLPVRGSVIDSGHYLKAKIQTIVTGARPVSITYDIEFEERSVE